MNRRQLINDYATCQVPATIGWAVFEQAVPGRAGLPKNRNPWNPQNLRNPPFKSRHQQDWFMAYDE